MALERGADIIVMIHPDYQYEPKLIPALAHLVASGVYDVALGSRILGRGAIKGGMPRIKYVANRVLTLLQNLLGKEKLSEYHTGYRAFSRGVLQSIPFEMNSNGFVFDNQVLSQVIAMGYRIGEMSCPTRYFPEASSINYRNSMIYGLGVVRCSVNLFLYRIGLRKSLKF
jgi:hypothetical protein